MGDLIPWERTLLGVWWQGVLAKDKATKRTDDAMRRQHLSCVLCGECLYEPLKDHLAARKKRGDDRRSSGVILAWWHRPNAEGTASQFFACGVHCGAHHPRGDLSHPSWHWAEYIATRKGTLLESALMGDRWQPEVFRRFVCIVSWLEAMGCGVPQRTKERMLDGW